MLKNGDITVKNIEKSSKMFKTGQISQKCQKIMKIV